MVKLFHKKGCPDWRARFATLIANKCLSAAHTITWRNVQALLDGTTNCTSILRSFLKRADSICSKEVDLLLRIYHIDTQWRKIILRSYNSSFQTLLQSKGERKFSGLETLFAYTVQRQSCRTVRAKFQCNLYLNGDLYVSNVVLLNRSCDIFVGNNGSFTTWLLSVETTQNCQFTHLFVFTVLPTLPVILPWMKTL